MPHELTLFIGRFHVLLVHLPVGFIVLLATFELLALVPRFKGAATHNGLIAALALPASLVSAGCGWLLSRGGGYDATLLQLHMWTGFGLAGACFVTYGLYHFRLWRAYRASLAATCCLLVVASHYGGSLTHGRDYLTRYAPQSVALLFGKKPAAPPSSTDTALLSRPVFSAAVQPVLEEYCLSCHGPEKSKGGLRLDTFAALAKGGDTGPAVVAGKTAESTLIKRLLLPLEDEEHMPPEGKPQLQPKELALLRWWIEQGAPEQKTLAELNPPESIRTMLVEKAAPTTSTNLIAPKTREDVLPIADRLAEELGISITSLAPNEPWFQANASLASTNFGDAELARLAPLAANLRWLDLAGTRVTDSGLTQVAQMPHLTRLHLERTGVGDDGLAQLARLKELEYLNFHGTEVTDAGLEHLKGLPKLRQVYLWNTQVSPASAREFAQAITDQSQIRQWRDEIAQLSARIREATVLVEFGASTNVAAVAMTPVNTNCPVSGKPIDAGQTTVHEGVLVAFCCTNCKAAFTKDPKPHLTKLNLPAVADRKETKPGVVEKVSATNSQLR